MTTLAATTRHQRWPSNRSEVLADLDVPFGDLVRDLALPVERLTDDLGELDVAAARLGRSRQVWFLPLRRRPRAVHPCPGRPA